MDGASDRPSGSQRGSKGGSSRGSQVGSQAGGSPSKGSSGGQASGSAKETPFGPSLGYDPARDPDKPKKMTPAEIVGKRVDLPPEAYLTVSFCQNFSSLLATN